MCAYTMPKLTVGGMAIGMERGSGWGERVRVAVGCIEREGEGAGDG